MENTKQHIPTEMMQFKQDEVNYEVISNSEGQVCANCRWFRSDSSYSPCHIVRNAPHPIVSGGWCNQWQEIPAETIENQMRSQEVESRVQEWIGKARDAWKSLFGIETTPNLEDVFTFKRIDDDRWANIWSNNYKDREKDIISFAALQDNVKAIRSGEYPMPALYMNHKAKYEHGVADTVLMIGNFAFASGVYHDPDQYPFVPIAKSLYDGWESKGIKPKVSHGFMYPTKQYVDRVFHKIRTYEISTLKPTYEANIATIAHPNLKGTKWQIAHLQ